MARRRSSAGLYRCCYVAVGRRLSRDPDPEAVTAGWLIIGAPWIWTGFLGQRYWLVVPLNGLTLYVLIVLGFTAYRKVFHR